MGNGVSSIPARYPEEAPRQFGAGGPPESSDTTPVPANGSESRSDSGGIRPELPPDGFIPQEMGYNYLYVSRTSFRKLRDEGWVKCYTNSALPRKDGKDRLYLDASEFRADAKNIMSGEGSPPHPALTSDG
jgi:hypothetical protein